MLSSISAPGGTWSHHNVQPTVESLRFVLQKLNWRRDSKKLLSGLQFQHIIQPIVDLSRFVSQKLSQARLCLGRGILPRRSTSGWIIVTCIVKIDSGTVITEQIARGPR